MKENQQLKTALKRDRGFWKKKKKRRRTPSPLKLITRCGNCGEAGHWHKECKNPHRPRNRSEIKGRPRTGDGAAAFTFAAANDDQEADLNGVTILGRAVLTTLKELISQETDHSEALLTLMMLECGL